MPKITGDLTLEGTNDTYATEIEYTEDNTMIGLSLSLTKPTGGGGGGGGGTTGTAFDDSTAGTPANFTVSNNGKTVVYGNDLSLESIESNTFYNTSSTDKIYIEIRNDWNNTTNQIGIAWGDSSQNAFYYRGNKRWYLRENGSSTNDNIGWNVHNGRVQRLFIVGRDVYIGYQIIGGGSGVNGDPENEGTPIATLPDNVDLKLYANMYNSGDSVTALLTTDTIESDPLGYTPIDD